LARLGYSVNTVTKTDRDPFYVGGTKYNSTNNERNLMDWENVIDWERVEALTKDEVLAILDIFGEDY